MYSFNTYTILLQVDSLLEGTAMAVLGKDIFDLYRPHTHTKIQFGDKGYWVEWGTDCLPYGSILTEILNCSITDYCAKLSAVEQAVAACDPETVMEKMRINPKINCFITIIF